MIHPRLAFTAVAMVGVLSLAIAPDVLAADLSHSRVAERTAKVTHSWRAQRHARHRAARRPGLGWVWVRRAHADRYKYVYREFGSYFVRGRPSCRC
jgi:hypothetical protein